MHLADFIETNIEPIMADWVAFASRLGLTDRQYTETDLRDSVLEILTEIVTDMRASQPTRDRSARSRGERPLRAPGITDQAHHHAEERRQKGYTLDEIVSEYRALRASIVRRWTEEMAGADRCALDELVGFNDALDQALTESVRRYSEGLARTRDLFEGILAHDLRSPLQAIVMSAGYLFQVPELPDSCAKAAVRIQASGARMQLLIQHLLDFTRTRLGDALPVNARPASMKAVCDRAIDEVMAFNPDRTIRATFRGDLDGTWDSERLAQVFTNLLGNAIQHGDPHSAILVDVGCEGDGVTATVFNHGPTIPADVLPTIFDPLCRAVQNGTARRTGEGLGLGLYIVRQIVESHGGSVSVTSRADGTIFTVHVPRRARTSQAEANATLKP